tara:strand:+ start:40380 stop:41036 length:657 start_codon:yes stop_codon:yes gene_type:complete
MTMNYFKYLGMFLLLLIFYSCQTSDKKKTDTIHENMSINETKYAIDTSGVIIVWTAYKFTNKVGVSGSFKNYTLQGNNKSGSVETILNNLKLSILTESVDSKNTVRDFKLHTYFFKVFNTPTIRGTIINAKENQGFMKLDMNQNNLKVPYTYSIKNDTIELFTNLNLNNWNGEKALNALKKECYDLHTGEDGISKLWPDVDISIKLPLKKTNHYKVHE